MTNPIANSINTSQKLILASQSPRRSELLAQLGYQFSVQPSDIDETVTKDEVAHDYVLRLAKQKAQHVFSLLSQAEQKHSHVLGSDTSVVFDGNILGKPDNEADCIKTLTLLSNNQHQVLTAIALASISGVVGQVISTEVSFKALTIEEISSYWLSGEPQDKAGSYGIQGIAGQFVKTINGSYSAVVGLPLYETTELLANAGFTGSIHAK
ncbi:Maf family protein [Colwellia psychrerythraea]|uniref:dTTP/UTP pyrophosphatase n=1 Tax=Colwellia psychrerythraea TaxID=28229 RepID=A0A099KRR5_COLPS|nr:Maf family protein [Colwellia psychrerythraea]KGJ92353.1 Septum formation protein Maf [Colwellia psychrerythraea]